MNRVVNALNAPAYRALSARSGAAGLCDRAGTRPGFAASCDNSRIFPQDFLPRQFQICIRKWLKINGRTSWQFNAAMRFTAAALASRKGRVALLGLIEQENYNTGTYTVTRETVDFFLGAASQ